MAITVQLLDSERTVVVTELEKAMTEYLSMLERSRSQLDFEDGLYREVLDSHMRAKRGCLKYLEREYNTIHENKINKLFHKLLKDQWEAWEEHKVDPDIGVVMDNCEEILDIFNTADEESRLPWDVQD